MCQLRRSLPKIVDGASSLWTRRWIGGETWTGGERWLGAKKLLDRSFSDCWMSFVEKMGLGLGEGMFGL